MLITHTLGLLSDGATDTTGVPSSFTISPSTSASTVAAVGTNPFVSTTVLAYHRVVAPQQVVWWIVDFCYGFGAGTHGAKSRHGAQVRRAEQQLLMRRTGDRTNVQQRRMQAARVQVRASRETKTNKLTAGE